MYVVSNGVIADDLEWSLEVIQQRSQLTARNRNRKINRETSSKNRSAEEILDKGPKVREGSPLDTRSFLLLK